MNYDLGSQNALHSIEKSPAEQPMSQDFFLLNRAHQINRLYGSTSDKRIQRPNDKLLARLPERARGLYALLDRICEVANAESAGDQSATLTDPQRATLCEFEQAVVRDRFAADEAVKEAAVQIIKAIYADAAYFSGLKPLPQYTEKFPYELLFPSWLNLLSAVMMPRHSGGANRARLDGTQQVELFRYLAACPIVRGERGTEFVGFLTFIASRFDAPMCEQMLQRAIDLVSRHGDAILSTLRKFDECTSDGHALKERFGNYLIAKYSLEQWDGESEYALASERPAVRSLPAALTQKIVELEQQEDYEIFADFLCDIVAVIESNQPFSIDFITALQQKSSDVPLLLKWILTDVKPRKLLSEGSQILLASIVSLDERSQSRVDIPRIQRFVKCIVRRAGGISESAVEFFRQQFLVGTENRHTLLDACDTELKLQKIAAMLLERAAKTDSNEKFIHLLSCVTVLDQSTTSLDAQVSLNALQSVIENRSIGNKELHDIIGDLQKNIGIALQTLAAPLSVAGEKSDRLVTLYLTLNEVGQTLYHSGKVDNFSVVRAKYARLSNFD